MAIFQIKAAQRTKTQALVAIWGGSSSGKTYSGLEVGRGMAGPDGKIGLIDTENDRALHYAGKFGSESGVPWDHLSLTPPFSPDRYMEAFQAFEYAGGYSVIIIDSISHVWEGEGGVLDMADEKANRKMGQLGKWKLPKSAFKRMYNMIMRSPIDVIFLMRAKTSAVQVMDQQTKKLVVRPTGLEPIFEKNGIYEMSVSVLLGMDHKPMFCPISDQHFCNHLIPPIKAPEEVLRLIKPGEYLTKNIGKAIKIWANGKGEDLNGDAIKVAARGMKELEVWFKGLPNNEGKRKIKGMMDRIDGGKGLKEIANDADLKRFQEDEEIDTPPEILEQAATMEEG